MFADVNTMHERERWTDTARRHRHRAAKKYIQLLVSVDIFHMLCPSVTNT